jgi:hypothetical protein
MASTASKSPSEAMGKPASRMSTPSSTSLRAIRSFLGYGHAAARRLFAIPQRGIEDVDSIAHRNRRIGPLCRGRLLIWQIYNISGRIQAI